MIQQSFAQGAALVVEKDPTLAGLAVGGSWLTGTLDAYSDLDLVVVTEEKITGNPARMKQYAAAFGSLLSGFTGEHVGEPRLLICLYDDPLLHVDLKFVTVEEFHERVEDPVILVDKGGRLAAAIEAAPAHLPLPDYQWIEDRFWTWIHYALLKIGRGELLEATDFLGYLRMVVLGPLLQAANGLSPRGVRRVETTLPPAELEALYATLCLPGRQALLQSLRAAVVLYRRLREELAPAGLHRQEATEERVLKYFEEIEGVGK
jgi:predicted nucleotidyltransferase